jgi:DEAD/DEAH box helicase domain-containing protein
MSIASLLSHWRAEPTIAGNVVEWHIIPDHPARYAPFPAGLHPYLIKVLRRRGIARLYTHQAEVWEHVQNGKNPVIVTGTASGKTLAYNLPVIDRLIREETTRGLYIFPTKALAHDQWAVIGDLLSYIDEDPSSNNPVNSAIYDGDTPANARPSIRVNARLVLSNPDMLHTGILPHHTAWAEYFKYLQFVVIDEMHTYRGVFGSHVANVIRRLKRVAHFYGAHLQFILTSATIDNPVELAERLIEEPVVLVKDDGAVHGTRHFLIYNPPVIDRNLGIRRSSLLESVRLVEDLLTYNIQTIIFARTRRTVELILTYIKDIQPGFDDQRSIDHGNDDHYPAPVKITPIIRGYRSGYLPHERRTIESGLRNGEVRAVVATNALELGIDIGSMGASILAGYPGTIAATWQQAGRAGRGNEISLAVLITSPNPLDQFLAHHPDYFFGRSPEQALINPDNPLILLGHLRCAAFELPFQERDSYGRVPSALLKEYLAVLVDSQDLYHSGSKYFWMADRYPADDISLRSASANRVLLQIPNEEGWRTIGEVDVESATWMVHPQAVYMHEAQTYLVDELDLERNIAHLHPLEIDYYTEPQSETIVQLVEQHASAMVRGTEKAHGEIQVTTQVKGFRKVKWFTHEHLAQGELSLPPSDLFTTGYWLALSEQTVASLRDKGLWANDPNQYGPAWDLIRQRVRARDNFRCQLCGKPENERSHDVHHKIPFRSFPSPELANQMDNLVTLCPSCHHRVETAVRIRTGLTGLAYVLGNLAPFFLMCDSRDLGIHSDPQSSLANGGPAVVLYDQIPAGIGFSERLFELHDELVTRAYELVSRCECSDGCPSCVGPGGENGYGGKKETMALLKELTGEG